MIPHSIDAAVKIDNAVKIIECPRDAWQGLPQLIPMRVKASYLRALVEAGFRHIDAVSFVSPQHVRQMADSEAVLQAFFASLPSGCEAPEIIGIVVNDKGVERALAAPGVTQLSDIRIRSPLIFAALMPICRKRRIPRFSRAAATSHESGAGRGLVVYVSMAFGNQYEEPWGPEIVEDTLIWLKDIGVRTISLADTVGTATPDAVGQLYGAVKGCVAGIELGVHLHSRPEGMAEKVMAAYNAGCRRFDSALTGLGGCPFAGDELVGNIATETVVRTLGENGIDTGLELSALSPVLAQTAEIRDRYAHA